MTLETHSTNISLCFPNIKLFPWNCPPYMVLCSPPPPVTPVPQRQGTVVPLAVRRALLILGQNPWEKQSAMTKNNIFVHNCPIQNIHK